MPDLKAGENLEPMMTRTIAVFTGTASAISDRMQPALHRSAVIFQEAGNLIGAFLTPAAVLALTFGLWRLSEELGWTVGFPVLRGPFAHWMVWIALAIGLKMTGSLMNRPLNTAGEESTQGPEQKN
jgi:hypothetical protein